jgi:phage gpG-like protein
MSLIEGQVTGAEAVTARLARLPSVARQAVVDAMRKMWLQVQTNVVRGKLSGDPLKRVTGNLASSINVGGASTATEFQEADDQIVGRVGTKVRYGAVHEYGGEVDVPSHERKITQVFGRPVSARTVVVRAYQARFPERSFLRSTLREMKDDIEAQIARAAQEAAEKA